MKSAYFFYIVLILSIACGTKKEKKTYKNDPKYSINELNLIGIDCTMKLLDIDFGLGKDSVFAYLKNIYGDSICDPGVYFGLKVHQRILKIKASEQCGIYCGLSPYLNVHIVNSDGIVHLNFQHENYDAVILDSLQYPVTQFVEQKLNLRKKFEHQWIGIRLEYETGVSQEVVLRTLEHIIQGYLNGVDKLSKYWYNRAVYLLKYEELNRLNSHLHFDLEIGYGIDGIENPFSPTVRFLELRQEKQSKRAH